jgi:hypothetical protein
MRVVTLRAALPAIFLLLFLLPPGLSAGEGEVFYTSRAEISTFSREMKLGPPAQLLVKPKRGFHSPVFSLTRPDGTTKYFRPARLEDGWTVFLIDFEKGKGAYRLELIVDSERGDTSAARFTIWVGVKRPPEGSRAVKKKSDKDYDPDDGHLLMLERKLFRHINDYRATWGLKPFPWLEKAAYLGRAHMRDYLKMKPRPKKLTHLIPSYGAIADRFVDFFAWPHTPRKFPIAEPDIGPEAVCYCSESLGAMRSVDWLFNEYFLKESAFRAPVLSEYPTHAAVGMVRDGKGGLIYSATIYVQVNSTRVLKEMEAEYRETVGLESGAKEPAKQAKFLRRLGQMGDPRSLKIFTRRLGSTGDPAVRSAALDSLLLNDPERAAAWMEKRKDLLEKARRDEDYRAALPYVLTLAGLKWNDKIKGPADRELAFVTRLAQFELEAALAKVGSGDATVAREQLAAVVARFPGLEAAKRAGDKLKELDAE